MDNATRPKAAMRPEGRIMIDPFEFWAGYQGPNARSASESCDDAIVIGCGARTSQREAVFRALAAQRVDPKWAVALAGQACVALDNRNITIYGDEIWPRKPSRLKRRRVPGASPFCCFSS